MGWRNHILHREHVKYNYDNMRTFFMQKLLAYFHDYFQYGKKSAVLHYGKAHVVKNCTIKWLPGTNLS